MSNLSKAACSLSIQHLFREAAWCYLWTFTFADDVSPDEAARRWRLFVRWLIETERKCVRVLESGSQHGRWHYHCVTPDRWDVNEIREAAARHGFGRINVKKLPAARAKYVAKYLNKDARGTLSKGLRRWACVGFDGVPVNRVKTSSKTLYLPKMWQGRAFTIVEWNVEGLEPSRTRIRVAETPEKEEIQHLLISAAQWDCLLKSMFETGEILIVGEYRGLTVTQKILEDDTTGTRIESAYIEHVIECGGNTRHVREWLPVGADVKAVVLPAEVGAMVKARLSSIRMRQEVQYLTGVVIPLLPFLPAMPAVPALETSAPSPQAA